jgi:hypothetical protein
MKTSVELHIEELVLCGLPYAQRYRITEAIEAELQRLVDDGGLPPSLAEGGRLPEVRMGDLKIAPGAKSGETGEHIAGAIYQSLTGGMPGRSKP